MKATPVAVTGAVLVALGSAAQAGPPAFAPVGSVTPSNVAPSGLHAPPPSGEAPAEAFNEILQRYCVVCHSGPQPPGGLVLAGFDVSGAVAGAEKAEKMIHKLRAGMMPPRGMPRPGGDTIQALAAFLETTIDEAAARDPNPGRRTFQRLNRAEYARSIRDLLGLDVDVAAFLPPETMSENFDNIADVQNLSATLMEGYLRAASHISRIAVGDPEATPSQTTYKVPKTASQLRHVEGAPYGTRGGISVVHNFPADGEYVFMLELHPGPTGFLYGKTVEDEERLEVSVNGERVALLNIDRWMSESDPGGMRIETEPVHVRAGPRRVSAAFLPRFDGPVDDLIKPVDYTLADAMIGGAYGVTTLPHLRDLAVSGPFEVTGVSDTPSRRRIFSCRPTAPGEEEPCAEEILRRLVREAYRRPATDDDVADLMAFYRRGSDAGGFEIGVRTALQALLASPHFIFRLEEAPADAEGVYPIGDLDLASRLSFFLWALPPDDELIDLARRGRLSDADVLREQTLRMLADPRAEALATRFASQWLRLQDLDKIHPDAQLYPYWDHTLAEAMKRETRLLFHHLVQEDRSLVELLTADYTFVNERLARHYGIPGVTGQEFRRVELTDPYRMGLLGHGSVLTMTSHADRTSPVLRGKWVLEVLLGTPPPPPPADVPDLEATEGVKEGGRVLTTRERMEAHRSNPMCMSCHQVIDPVGLALDNFDVTGAWRIKENGMPLDTRGELYDGTPIQTPGDLRAALLRRPTVIVRTFAKNLMAYALGRRVEYFDMPTIRDIERQAEARDYHVSAFVLGVVNSPAFRMSRADAVTEEGESEGPDGADTPPTRPSQVPPAGDGGSLPGEAGRESR